MLLPLRWRPFLRVPSPRTDQSLWTPFVTYTPTNQEYPPSLCDPGGTTETPWVTGLVVPYPFTRLSPRATGVSSFVPVVSPLWLLVRRRPRLDVSVSPYVSLSLRSSPSSTRPPVPVYPCSKIIVGIVLGLKSSVCPDVAYILLEYYSPLFPPTTSLLVSGGLGPRHSPGPEESGGTSVSNPSKELGPTSVYVQSVVLSRLRPSSRSFLDGASVPRFDLVP